MALGFCILTLLYGLLLGCDRCWSKLGHTPKVVRHIEHRLSVLHSWAVLTSPYIHCGRSTPPLPIAIQCISMTEAQRVQSAMQHVLDSVTEVQPSTTQLLKAFGDSSAVRNLLLNGPFYSVVVGSPPGIHRTRFGICSLSGAYVKIWHAASQRQRNSFRTVVCSSKMGEDRHVLGCS